MLLGLIGMPLLAGVWIAWLATGLRVDTPANLPEVWHGTVSDIEDAEVVSVTADGHVLHRGAHVTLNELARDLTRTAGRPLLICADEEALALYVSYLMEVGLRTDPNRRLLLATRCMGRTEALPVRTSRGISDTFVLVLGGEREKGRYLSFEGRAANRGELRENLIHAFRERRAQMPEEDPAGLEQAAQAWASVGFASAASCDDLVQAVDVLVGLGASDVVVTVP